MNQKMIIITIALLLELMYRFNTILSKSQLLFCGVCVCVFSEYDTSKIHLEIQETQDEKNNVEKEEQNCRTHTF